VRLLRSESVRFGLPPQPESAPRPHDDEVHCRHCNSTSYGYGCPYSGDGRHVHGPGSRCVHCGSTAVGFGCPYSHDKKHNRME
jgi:hypothetical protein